MAFIQYGFSTAIVAAGEVITIGKIVCVLPADAYRFYIATTANMALATEYAGCSLDDATEDNPFRLQDNGLIGHDITGLGAGASGACYVSTTGTFTRTVTSYRCGYVNSIGDVFLNRADSSGGIPSIGAANTVFQTNAGATATEWETIFNANVDPSAGIVGSSGGLHKIVPTYGTQPVTFSGYAEIGATPVAASGAIRMGSNQVLIGARNFANTADVDVLAIDASNNVIIGDTVDAYGVELNAPIAVEIYTPTFELSNIAGTPAVTFAVDPAGTTNVNFAATTTPTVTQTATGSATGVSMRVEAQGAATTGGSLVIVGGAGSSEANRGKIELVGALSGSVVDSLPMRLGTSAISYTADSNKTLTAAEYSNPVLFVTSTLSLTATRDMVVPLTVNSTWFVVNSSTGSQSIRIIGASGTGITVPTGAGYAVRSDGTNIVLLIQGAAGAAGAAGPAGSAGSNGSNSIRYVQTFTASGSFTPAATVNCLDYIILIGGGGGGGGGAGGGAGSSGGAGGGGGGGSSGAGDPGHFACFANVDCTPSSAIGVTIGAGGAGGTAGGGGTASGSGSPGNSGSTGGSTSFGPITVSGGAGSDGSDPGQGGGTRTGGTAGVASQCGDGEAGGNGSAAGTGANGGSSTTMAVNAIPLYAQVVQSITFSGTTNGNTGSSGGTGGGGAGGGGGGGAGGTVGNNSGLRPTYLPQNGATVNCQSAGAGGGGGAAGVAGSNGAAASGTQTYGTGGCGGAGGGGGGNGTFNGGSGAAGGNGGNGIIFVSWVEPQSQI